MRYLLLFLLTTTLCEAEPWDATDKALFKTYIVLNVIDVHQTRKALSQGGVDLNPVFGSHPSTAKLVGIKTVGIGAIYLLADSNNEHRQTLLWIVTIMQLAVVRHNYFEIGF